MDARERCPPHFSLARSLGTPLLPPTGCSTSTSSMTWRRLPSFLPNLSLKLLPLNQAARDTFAKTGFLSQLAFRVPPSTNKARPSGAAG